MVSVSIQKKAKMSLEK